LEIEEFKNSENEKRQVEIHVLPHLKIDQNEYFGWLPKDA
jgi:hypothetical protein